MKNNFLDFLLLFFENNHKSKIRLSREHEFKGLEIGEAYGFFQEIGKFSQVQFIWVTITKMCHKSPLSPRHRLTDIFGPVQSTKNAKSVTFQPLLSSENLVGHFLYLS